MSLTKYTYSIQNDFPNEKIDSTRLAQEIRASAIVTAFDCINTSSDVCDIWFKDALSSGDETILDGVVDTHDGTALEALDLVAMKIAKSDGSTAYSPIEEDGKQVYVMSPSTEGLYTWLTARGDDLSPTPPSSGRGEGNKIYLSWDGNETPWPSTKEVELDWCEPIELHDGHMNFDPTNWGFADEWSFFVRLPANTPVANGGGTGNCNMVEIPDTGGTMHIIVPAAGDGAYDIDLDTAVPAPCGKLEDGYWSIEDKWNEVIVANSGPVVGTWNLYDFVIEMNFMKNLNCGDPRGVWDLDAYKAEWISSRWKMVLQCTRNTAGAGEMGGDLMCFRPGAL